MWLIISKNLSLQPMFMWNFSVLVSSHWGFEHHHIKIQATIGINMNQYSHIMTDHLFILYVFSIHTLISTSQNAFVFIYPLL